MSEPKWECQGASGQRLGGTSQYRVSGLGWRKRCPHMEVTGYRASESVETMLSVFAGCQG